MKTKEFIKKVESLGLEVHDFSRRLEVSFCGTTFATTSKDNEYFGIKKEIESLTYREKLSLLKILIEYSETPVEEREEPKKYYLTLPYPYQIESQYLNNKNGSYMFANNIELSRWQTKFTQEEIDNLPNQDFIQSLIKEEVC